MTNDRFSSSSYAVLIAVIRLPIPPDAAHRASAIASATPRPAPVCWTETSVSWSVMILRGFLRQRPRSADRPGWRSAPGRRPARRSAPGRSARGTGPGSRRRPRRRASSGTWSALASAQPRLTICSQPRLGISVGLSASPPGTSCLARSGDISSVWLTLTPRAVCCLIARLLDAGLLCKAQPSEGPAGRVRRPYKASGRPGPPAGGRPPYGLYPPAGGLTPQRPQRRDAAPGPTAPRPTVPRPAGFGPAASLLHAHRAQHVVGQPAVELGDGSLGQQGLEHRQGQRRAPFTGIRQAAPGPSRPPGPDHGRGSRSSTRLREVEPRRRSVRSSGGWSGATRLVSGGSPAPSGRAALHQRTYADGRVGSNGGHRASLIGGPPESPARFSRQQRSARICGQLAPGAGDLSPAASPRSGRAGARSPGPPSR